MLFVDIIFDGMEGGNDFGFNGIYTLFWWLFICLFWEVEIFFFFGFCLLVEFLLLWEIFFCLVWFLRWVWFLICVLKGLYVVWLVLWFCLIMKIFLFGNLIVSLLLIVCFFLLFFVGRGCFIGDDCFFFFFLCICYDYMVFYCLCYFLL